MANPKIMERSQPAPEPETEPVRKVKTYYVATEGLDVYYGPVVGSEVQNQKRAIISFSRGTHQTDDPGKQAFLDTYPGCVSYEVWLKTHVPEKEREEMKTRENERLQSENNALLAKIKELEKARE